MESDVSDWVKRCHANAEQCRARAESTDHPPAKEELLQAAQWERLAHEIDQIGKMGEFVREHSRSAGYGGFPRRTAGAIPQGIPITPTVSRCNR